MQVLISGLLLGGLYACLATGFSLVTGVMRILNFSHGALVMLGAYVTFWLFNLYGIDPLLTIPISMLVLFCIGYVIQRYLINHIVRAPTFMTLTMTFGLDMVIVNAALLMWTGNVRAVTPSYAGLSLDLSFATIPVLRLVAFAAALVLTGCLYLLITRTATGRSINATRMDLDAARLCGVKVDHIYALTFGLGAAMAGAAGSLISLVQPIYPAMGTLFAAKAFAICIIGGFGHMVGALVGGLVLGVLETIGAVSLGVAYQQAISFGILLLILIIRPLGIMGKEYY